MKPEQITRQEKIDLQLGRAGWAVGSRRLIQEFLIPSPASFGDEKRPYRTRNEFADYALVDRLDRLLAIAEAKRSSRDPLEGERQAADYADAIRAKYGCDPFIFLANGPPPSSCSSAPSARRSCRKPKSPPLRPCASRHSPPSVTPKRFSENPSWKISLN